MTFVLSSANPDLERVIAECKKSSGVTEEILTKLYNFDVIDDHAGFCFQKCYCKTFGLCDQDLKVSAEGLLIYFVFLPSEKVTLNKFLKF